MLSSAETKDTQNPNRNGNSERLHILCIQSFLCCGVYGASLFPKVLGTKNEVCCVVLVNERGNSSDVHTKVGNLQGIVSKILCDTRIHM